MRDIKDDLILWFIIFLFKSQRIVVLICRQMIKLNKISLLQATHKLAEELHKPIIRNFKKRIVCSRSKDYIWGADLADMQLIREFNKGFRFLLRFIDTFSKYASVVPLKDKKGVNIADAFQKISDDSNRKLNKIWADKGSEFYNNSF